MEQKEYKTDLQKKKNVFVITYSKIKPLIHMVMEIV